MLNHVTVFMLIIIMVPKNMKERYLDCRPSCQHVSHIQYFIVTISYVLLIKHYSLCECESAFCVFSILQLEKLSQEQMVIQQSPNTLRFFLFVFETAFCVFCMLQLEKLRHQQMVTEMSPHILRFLKVDQLYIISRTPQPTPDCAGCL